MSTLPETSFTLHGSCNCKAIRYVLPVPALQSRQIWIPASESAGQGDIRVPFFSIDHCNDCRQATGSLLNFWMVAGRSDLKFQCLPRDGGEERIQLSTEDLIFPSPTSEKTFIAHYTSSRMEAFNTDVIRSFCGRCGTGMSCSVTPWPLQGVGATCSIAMGTLDREDLEKEGVRPEKHLFCDVAIDWVVKMLSEGDQSLHGSGTALPKHPGWHQGEFVQ